MSKNNEEMQHIKDLESKLNCVIVPFEKLTIDEVMMQYDIDSEDFGND